MGVAIAFYPIMGTRSLVTIGIAFIFRLHVAAMFLAQLVVFNPLTAVPIFTGNFHIGKLLLGFEDISLPEQSITVAMMFELGWKVIASLLVGGLLLGSVFAIASYPIVRFAIHKTQDKTRPNP